MDTTDEHIEHPHHRLLISRIRILLIVIFGLICASAFLTYKYYNKTPAIESIQNYDVRIEVQGNKSMLVTETIVYNFGYNKKKGISRYIPLTAGNKPRLNVSVLGVEDESGQPYKYEILSTEKDVVALKIGDPEALVSGTKTYRINYIVKNAISVYDGFDEIYWNVTGDQWPLEIKKSSASVILPGSAAIDKMDCYTGPRGSTERNCSYSVSEADGTTNIYYSTTRPLMNIEGFTILLDFKPNPQLN